ncbi:MAG: molybdopterin cofactor-binding domain-containing protein [Nitrospirales bacterium]
MSHHPENLIDNPNTTGLTRRSFLVGSVGASVMMAFGFAGLRGVAQAISAPETLAAKTFAPTVWFEINKNGNILINIAKAEMGQHVGTALARVIAEELGANWDDVSIKHVDADPKWGFMITGGSWSVFKSFTSLSQAGAAGRVALIEAGARLLDKPSKQCDAIESKVVCGEQSITFAEIIQKAKLDRSFSEEELAALPLKPAKQRRLVGKSSQAIDIPAKTNGSAQFGIDVDIPGMVYARPIIPPTRYGSTVKAIDDAAAQKVSGYIGYQVLKDPSETLQGWVTVVADNYASAIKAADAVKVEYQAGPTANVDEADIQAEGERLINDSTAGFLLIDDGDVEQARGNATTKLDAQYRTSSVLHFQMEPVNATAELKDDIWHIHTGCQSPSLILPIIAKSLGVSEEKIEIHQYFLGGGFGRRLFGDYIIPAALTAQAIGKPVKMIFTRPDDSRFDCLRSPSVQQFHASLDEQGNLTSVEHAVTAGWPTLSLAPGLLIDSLDKKGKIDPFSSSGADHWYSLPNHRVRMINNDLAQRSFLPGYLRAVGPGWIGWGVESFMDEVATAANKDPLDFRLELLDGKGKNAGNIPESVGGAKRLANVLKVLKKQSGWGKSLPKDEGRGVATAFGQERTMPTWVACAAHVHVSKQSGQVTVKKLSVAVDCGTVVHPDGALAQMEGSTLWGLSLALHEGTHVEQGQVAADNLHSYTPLRMADVPELDIQFIESEEFPVGLGEPGLIVVAPAIANAIYAAVGVRVRDLPIRPEAILEGVTS